MGRRKMQPETVRFIAIAVVFMLLMDHFIFDGKRSYIEQAKTHKVVIEKPPELPPPVRVEPEDGAAYFENPLPEEGVKAPPSLAPLPSPRVRGDREGGSKIAIIIDDLGMDIKRSRAVLDLPAPLTLAFLPYGTKTRELAKAGKEKGHSLIIHVPMQAENGDLNIGPGGLKEGMTDTAFDAAVEKMLSSFEGYEGINNHMGSRLTQDSKAMARLMNLLSERNLFFVDSKTSPKSVAAYEAQMIGVPFAERDVFLDHVESLEFARQALRHTEQLALRRGYAIAIGHPKDHTIAALKEWIPTLKDKGIELVAVKALLVRPTDVIPAQAGIQREAGGIPQDFQGGGMDPRLRGDDEVGDGDDGVGGGESVDPPIKSGDDIHKLGEDIQKSGDGIKGIVYGPVMPEIELHPLPELLPAP